MLIYNPKLTYEENFNRDLPEFSEMEIVPNTKISAGPVLNSKYVNVFAELGYFLITYKTVRSYEKEPNKFPNILVKTKGEWKHPNDFDWSNTDEIEAITNFFGIPSKSPDFWMKDVDKAAQYLKPDQKLVLSFVGDDLEDTIRTAELAKKTKADLLEWDASCPHSGELFYLNPEIVREVTEQIPNLIVKVGSFSSYEKVKEFVSAIGGIYAIEAINGVRKHGFSELLGSEYSGICGPDILETGLKNVKWLAKVRKEENLYFKLIGVGGIRNANSAKKYIEARADIIGMATFAMLDPYLLEKI